MATAAVTGRLGFLGISATSTGTSAEVGEVRNYSIEVSQAQIDATSNDSSGWVENLAGIRSWRITAEAMYARENEQVLLRESLSSAATRYFTVQPSTAVTAKWTGTGRIESYTVGGTYDGAALFNLVIAGNGALAYTT